MQWADELVEGAAEGFTDGVNGVIGSGATFTLFDGTLPADVTDPDDGTEIIVLDVPSPMFNYASGPDRMLLAAAMTDTTAVLGTMQYWRLKNSGGDVLMQGTAGTSGTDVDFTPTNVVSGTGALVSVSAFGFPLTTTIT